MITYDQEISQQRQKGERLCTTLQPCRSVATRYDKLKATFLAFVTLALLMIMGSVTKLLIYALDLQSKFISIDRA